MNLIFLTACAVLFFVPLYFVINSVYQDGVFGRASLLSISFCAAGFLLEAMFGKPIHMPPIGILLVASIAVFLSWHLFRFHRRVLHKDRAWKQPSLTKTT